MKKFSISRGLSFSLITIIFFTLFSPDWLSIQGIKPIWSVLWLLPIALEFGPLIGALFASFLAILIDSLGLGGVTYLPSFILLGFCWGCIGRKNPKIELSLNLGLLAWFGTTFLVLTLWMQEYFIHSFSNSFWLNAWALHTLLAKAIINGLLAPIVCSWLLILLRSSKNKFISNLKKL